MAGKFAQLADHLDYLDHSVSASGVNTYTASRVLALVDAGCVVEMNSASAITITIPTNSAVPFPIGTSITIVALGAGAVTVGAQGGVTLLSAGSAVAISGQYAAASIYQRAADVWILFGSLV